MTGATTIVVTVGPVTFNVTVGALIEPKAAEMVLIPTPTAVPFPVGVIVATPDDEEPQVTWLLTSRSPPSL